MHICVSKLNIIGAENGLPSVQRQAIIWTIARILLIQMLRTSLSEIHTFSFTKMHLKMLSAKRLPFCLILDVLMKARYDKTEQLIITQATRVKCF